MSVKLTLAKETLRILEDEDLLRVVGGHDDSDDSSDDSDDSSDDSSDD